MEERVPQTPTHHDDDETIREDHIQPENSNDCPKCRDKDHEQDHVDDLPLPSETYVVQVPKDQIYRAPPPENSLHTERNWSPTRERNNRSMVKRYCCAGLVGLGVIATMVGYSVFFYLNGVLYDMKHPVFHVESFLTKNVSSGLEFDVVLKVKNPFSHSHVLYKRGGQSSLWFKQKRIAIGRFPPFRQEKKNTTDVKLTLRDSGGTLPSEIKTLMSSEKAGSHLSFTLKVTVTARMQKGFFEWRNEYLSVSCDYTIDKLTGGTYTRILSEKCRSNLD